MPVFSLFTLCVLFDEPCVGKVRAKRLEENLTPQWLELASTSLCFLNLGFQQACRQTTAAATPNQASERMNLWFDFAPLVTVCLTAGG